MSDRLWKASWEYCGDPLGTPLVIPPEWYVLEVGPGRNPWERAHVYVDQDFATINRMQVEMKKAVQTDVCSLPVDWDKKFDFVFAAHILEHTTDPVKAAAELSRVAKAGIVICPGPSKDALFADHELDHKWWVFAGKDRLYFKPIPDGYHEAVHDTAAGDELHIIFRHGEPRLGEDSKLMRRWFHRAEPHLDTIFRWEGELKVEVLT